MSRCFFIGHRETDEQIVPILTEVIERHIQMGVTQFVVGRYGGFDRLVKRVLLSLKPTYPHIQIVLLLPYHPATYSIEVSDGFDDIFYPPNMNRVPHKAAVVCANQYMVDHVDYVIAYAWHPASNARELLEYAIKKRYPPVITNLATDLFF